MTFEFLGINYFWIMIGASVLGMIWSGHLLGTRTRAGTQMMSFFGGLLFLSNMIAFIIVMLDSPEYTVITSCSAISFIAWLLLLIGSLLKEGKASRSWDI